VLALNAGFESHSFVVIDTSTGRSLTPPRRISGRVFALSPDGWTLYGFDEGAIESVEARSGERVVNRLFPEERTPPDDYDHIALSDDGSIGIAASGTLAATFPTDSLGPAWSTRTRTPIHAVAIEPRSRQFSILTGPSDDEWATVRAFDLTDGSELWSNLVPYVTHSGYYDPRPGVLRYSPDFRLLAVSMGYEDADVSPGIGEEGGTLVLGVDGTFILGPVPGRFADFDATGSTMATIGNGRGTGVWDLERRSPVGLPYQLERDPSKDAVAQDAVLVDEDFLATGGTALRRWRRGTTPALTDSPTGGPFVYAVAADPGGRRMAISRGVPYRGLPAEASETVLTSAHASETDAPQPGEIVGATDSALLMVESGGDLVAVDWTTGARTVAGDLPITETVLAASPDGRWVAMVDSYAESEFRLFQLGPTTREVSPGAFDWPRDVGSAYFLPDGKTLLILSADEVLSLALTEPRLHTTTLLPNDGIVQLAVRPDGAEIAVAHVDGHIELVALPSLDRRTIDRTDERISFATLAYSGDGQLLASVTDTGDLYLHDVATGRLLMRTQWWSHDLLPFGSGSEFLVTTPTGVVRWDFDPKRLVNTACSLAGRSLTREEWATYLQSTPYSPSCG
jgi:WD40 repeat protein